MNNFNLFGIGPMELIFILIIALVVLGPERLPQVARELVKLVAQVREIYTELAGTLQKEFGDIQELQELKEIQKDLAALQKPIKLDQIGKPAKKSTRSTGSADAAADSKPLAPKPSPAPSPAAEPAGGVDVSAAAPNGVVPESEPAATPDPDTPDPDTPALDTGTENRIAPPTLDPAPAESSESTDSDKPSPNRTAEADL